MIEINNDVYKTIAHLVKNSIYESGFINRTLSITIRPENATKIELLLSFSALNVAHLSVPICWECHTTIYSSQINNDFSWDEMLKFL